MMPAHRLMVLFVASAILAGCIQTGDEQDADDAPTTVDGPRLGAESGLPLALSEPGSLDTPPEPVLGRWWNYEVDNLLLGSSYAVTTVLAGVEDDKVLVGLAEETFDDEAFVLHLPPVGEVKKDTLEYIAHDIWIMALEFPITEGNEWGTKWYGGQDMRMKVDRIDGSKAEIAMDHPNGPATLVYDAEVGNIVSLYIPGFADMKLTDHGFGFEGDVQVPYGVDLVVCHGRFAGGAVIEDCAEGTAGPPMETITIEGDYDRLSFGLIVFDLAGDAPAGSGYFHLAVTAPDGTEYEVEKTPDQAGNVGVLFGHDDPVGDWEMTAVATGAGIVLFEGAAYRLFEVRLGTD